MKLGVIQEYKIPPDSRVPLVPVQCATILKNYDLELCIESSLDRCFPDEDYQKAGVSLVNDLTDCDILMGVKEIPVKRLLPNKTYFFFSHTIKEQAHNRTLLQAVLEKNIRLIDYEVLTNEFGKRLIAFGRFAGMVGAHNAILAFGRRTGEFTLKRMKDCHDYEEAKSIYNNLDWPPMKIVLTGTGRVGMGAAQVLIDMGIKQISPDDFLKKNYEHAVFTQLLCDNYVARKDGKEFNKKDFYKNPHLYKSTFTPFTEVADVMINGIYWDQRAPQFFTQKEMNQPNFNIKVIADVTCDIAPVSSIPSTLRASTIENPIFGYDPEKGCETAPFAPNSIDMMTIDNLPNELCRDASTSFGQQFIQHILPELFKDKSEILERAIVAEKGRLGKYFQYLQNYVNGK
ncbi:MAG: NAD(P)-dependent oxidoreductase [Bacteroidetes bacterium]|jgi:alanine dehydrogenase|nr:NAD(P)-dependent oxidoreductase [Bacteroidota bacterium]MDF1868443.1 NAD(P)-dependent oxidoreductase [Saprospiraceae bacterium]